MSEKSLDRKGRWRNNVVAFRASSEENAAIDEAAYLAGTTKQDYIINKLLDRSVIVERSPRTYKALNEKMNEIISELQRIQSAGEMTDTLSETIKYVTYIYSQNKED